MTNHKEETDRPFIVCPRCQGNGTTGPGWVYTQEDRDEMGYEWFEHAEDLRAGRYDIMCDECGGKRVVRDECDCDECEQDRYEEAEYQALVRAERAFGC